MSHPTAANTFLFSFPPANTVDTYEQTNKAAAVNASGNANVNVKAAAQPVAQQHGYTSSASPDDFDAFDFDSLNPQGSPASFSFEFENTFGLSPSSSSAPSTNVFSPKSAASDFNLVPDNELNNDSPTNLNTAEALSNHHLQRYLHYKALAEQAEAQTKILSDQLESLFTYGMPVDSNANAAFGFDNANAIKDMSGNMLAFQPQGMVSVPPPQQPVYGVMDPWQQQQQQQQQHVVNQSSDNFHAQAQAHMQAHQAAQMSMSVPAMPTAGQGYYMPAAAPVDNNTAWSRQSTSSSIASASVPTTPAAAVAIPMTMSMTAPSVIMPAVASSEGESELDRHSIVSDDDIKPSLPVDIPLTNLNGGGRGYVPGQTPDDPKKRHKCSVCGRGFARAFNLKSHFQTHNPLRSKPHMCPHGNCQRGFSRLHDLERHRQGIHSDGPLVEAKSQGVAPSVARAKDRIQKRAASGSLI